MPCITRQASACATCQSPSRRFLKRAMARRRAVARWGPMLPPREVTLNQRVGGSSPPRPTNNRVGSTRAWGAGSKTRKGPALVQPILLFELARQVFLGEVLEVLVGEGVQFVFESAREHPLDLLLPALLLEPRIAEELAGAGDVFVVQLDAHGARQAVRFRVSAREPDELGLRNGHALALEGKVDRALLDDRVDVVAPRVVVHEDIDGQPLLLVEPPRQPPDAAGRLTVSRQENAVVPPPELVFREPVALRAFLDQEDEIGRALLDLYVFRHNDGGHGIAALPELRPVHPGSPLSQDQWPDDAEGVLGSHV